MFHIVRVLHDTALVNSIAAEENRIFPACPVTCHHLPVTFE